MMTEAFANHEGTGFKASGEKTTLQHFILKFRRLSAIHMTFYILDTFKVVLTP